MRYQIIANVTVFVTFHGLLENVGGVMMVCNVVCGDVVGRMIDIRIVRAGHIACNHVAVVFGRYIDAVKLFIDTVAAMRTEFRSAFNNCLALGAEMQFCAAKRAKRPISLSIWK